MGHPGSQAAPPVTHPTRGGPATLGQLAVLVGPGGVHRPNTVLDLGGRTLTGELPGNELVLGVWGLVLRGGTLALPDRARVRVAAPNVGLDRVGITGTGPRGELGLVETLAGLLVVEGAGNSVELRRWAAASPGSGWPS
jgi:hypothetical protein